MAYVPPHGFANRLRASLHMLVGHAPDDSDREPPTFQYPPAGMQLRMLRLRHSLYVCGALAALVVVGYLLIPDSTPIHHVDMVSAPVSGTIDAPMNGRVSRGDASIDAQGVPPPSRSIDIAGLNVAPPPSPRQPETDILGFGADSRAAMPGTAPAATRRGNEGEPPATAAERDTNGSSHVSRELAIARNDMGRNSLWPAHRALTDALAAEPHNADALRLRAELAPREHERDSLIKRARQCARNGEWGCTREYARRAASVDASSRDAKRLLARASGVRRERFARRESPDLLRRLHEWFQQSVAQAAPSPPSRPWDHP